jgi:hypothetical protein
MGEDRLREATLGITSLALETDYDHTYLSKVSRRSFFVLIFSLCYFPTSSLICNCAYMYLLSWSAMLANHNRF